MLFAPASSSFLRVSCLLLAASAGRVIAAPAATEQIVKLDEFVVAPSHYGIAETRTAVGATLTSRELEVLPQLGDDLFRSIARLPGLAADDFTAQFWVRGAPQRELLARLDGVELIEPFHLKDVDGALSIVDPRAIQQLALTTGGFTAEFGNRLGGVLMMETKTPTRRRTSLGLSLTGVGAGTEGLFGRGSSWLASARRGYPDVALRVAGRDDEVEPRYYDVTGKVEFQLAPEHRLAAHVLHAGDSLRSQRTNRPSLRSSYDSTYGWLRWLGKPTPELSGEAVLSWAQLTWKRDGDGRLDGLPFALRDRRELALATLRHEWSYVPTEWILSRAGVEVKSGEARYRYAYTRQRTIVSGGRQVVVTDAVNRRLDPSGEAWGAFLTTRVQAHRALVIEPGMRFDRHDYTNDREWGPRLNGALTLGPATLRAAWGRHAQAQGLHELDVADNEDTFHRAGRAEHRVVSIEIPWRKTVVRVEGYERLSDRLPARWENVDNGYDLFPEVQLDRLRLAPSEGRARGVELMLSGRGAVAWNLSYALAEAEERLAGRWVPRARDQRHTWRGDVTWAPNPRWEFSAAAQFHTGWPTTDVVYSLATLTNGRRVTVAANGPVYGERLPDYHRLDLRATRRFQLRNSELRVFLDVFNAYDRVNVIGYDHRVTIEGNTVNVVRKPRDQLPLLPSIGVEWGF